MVSEQLTILCHRVWRGNCERTWEHDSHSHTWLVWAPKSAVLYLASTNVFPPPNARPPPPPKLPPRSKLPPKSWKTHNKISTHGLVGYWSQQQQEPTFIECFLSASNHARWGCATMARQVRPVLCCCRRNQNSWR
uniref:Uncharacterized protein n=1 Tax=Pipistrellus kuhlii TaxID=59472 RepID=A0A7J7Y9F2_PIPKU|nr:hypothetical protein mPipKuh1_010301 [Pipistrellus kuhlii]